MRYPDRLRPPNLTDPLAGAYKDWLHLNIFEARSELAVILNCSLQGDPTDSEAVASATALVRVGSHWSFCNTVVAQSEAHITEHSIGFDGTLDIQLDPVTNGIEARFTAHDFSLTVTAIPLVDPIHVDRVPFGSGWIGWHAISALQISGTMTMAGVTTALDGAIGYHDHNWGRWYWGDNIGWEWATLLSSQGTIVMSRATDRNHRLGVPNVKVSIPARGGRWASRSYSGPTVAISYEDWRRPEVQRIPGAMAALHTCRMRPRLPMTTKIAVNDGFDRVDIAFRADDVLQVVTADPTVAGYSYIHELVGTFSAVGTSGGRAIQVIGDGVFEYVD